MPTILHVIELTQPQGHSTSGSHERYKSDERLSWEEDWDCLVRMRAWMLDQGIAGDEELAAIEDEERGHVRDGQKAAWEAYRAPLDAERGRVVAMLGELASQIADGAARGTVEAVAKSLQRRPNPYRRDLMAAAREALLAARDEDVPARGELARWDDAERDGNRAALRRPPPRRGARLGAGGGGGGARSTATTPRR